MKPLYQYAVQEPHPHAPAKITPNTVIKQSRLLLLAGLSLGHASLVAAHPGHDHSLWFLDSFHVGLFTMAAVTIGLIAHGFRKIRQRKRSTK